MNNRIIYIYAIMCTLLVGCKDSLTDGLFDITRDRIIKIGGVLSDDVITVQTRAGETTDTVRAETVDWMKGALRHGLDITYSNLKADGSHETQNEAVAILKWKGTIDPTSQRGDYTFLYKSTTTEAEWYDNGPHYFEGQYVPELIRDGNGHTMRRSDLTTNQSDDSDYAYTINPDGTESTTGTIGNYTLLSHYVGMPPNWTTSATVDQVLLPFKHRLARVIAYILIDPDLKDKSGLNTAKLEGYNIERDAEGNITTKDNASNTELRFANVKVLDYVQETAASDGAHTEMLTPMWTEARRVIPHFETELTQSVNNKQELAVPTTATDAEKTDAQSGFIVYTRKYDEKKIHPRETELWYEAHTNYLKYPDKNYTRKVYKSVPVYDIIVRPTYKNAEDVMYDEKDYYNADKTLNTSVINDLKDKDNSIEFEMTLNNGLIYTKKFDFDLNANKQTIVYITIDRESIDYDNSSSETWITPPAIQSEYYGVNNDLGHNMSMAGSSWQRAFRIGTYNPGVTDGNNYGAIENGEYVGQYVDETTWKKAFAQAYEGGEHHGDYFILDKSITIDATQLPDNFVFTGHLDARGNTITITGLNTSWNEDHYTYDEITDYSNLPATIYEKVGSDYVVFSLPTLYTANYYTQAEIDAAQEGDPAYGKSTTDIKDYSLASPTISEVMTGSTVYYIFEFDGQNYSPYSRPTKLYAYVNHPISHISGSSLFAGLDAKYTTEQEKAPDPFAKNADGTPVVTWEANVHKENGLWVPVKGYRAELYNVKLSGGTFFPSDAVFCGDDLDRNGATVTGYIFNCWEGSTPISNKVPIPRYN